MNKTVLGGLVGSLLALSSTSAHAVGSALYPGEWLLQGQRLVAPGCYYHLEMQTDANLVLYAGSQAIWSSNSAAGACSAFSPCRATFMQFDGNLVNGIVGAWDANSMTVVRVDWLQNGGILWSSGSYGHNGAFLSLQNNGNLVIKDVSGNVFWQSNTAGEVAAQIPCNRSSRTAKMVNNRDRPGGDYRSFEIMTWDMGLCGKVCALDSQCQAFAVAHRNGITKCWLKNTIPALVPATGVQSGYIRTPTSCTDTERAWCGAVNCGCVDHQCAGGSCPGSGCSEEETHGCAAFGCFCSRGQCTGGMCG